MKTINAELEKIIYDEARFKDAVQTIVSDVLSQSTTAIKKLKANFEGEIDSNVESLKIFADEALFQTFLDNAKQSYLGAIKFIPDTEKSRITAMYDNLYDTCIDSVRTLQRLFKLPYSLHYDGTSLSVDEKEVSKKIKPNFEIKLSDEEREYYSLVAGVVNSLNAMNDFEEQHNYVKFSYNGINRINQFGFFQKVAPMAFYMNFTEATFLAALRGGTLGVEKDN